MAQATMSARIDADDKHSFDFFCDSVGLNTSTAINLFVKTVIRERRIPFDIVQPKDPFYSDENMTRLEEAINNVNTGKKKLTKHELIED